jgi:perosamine synthetase
MSERRGVGLLKLQVQYAGWNALYRPSRYWQVKRLFHRLSAAGAAEGNYNATGEVAGDFGWRMAGPIHARLVQKLKQAAHVAEHAKWAAGFYDGQIHSEAVTPVFVPEGAEPVYARYPLFVDNKAALLERAEEAGVEVADWYTTPVHPLERADWAAVGYRAGLCPNAELACARIVSLPTGPRVTEADIERTVSLLNGF